MVEVHTAMEVKLEKLESDHEDTVNELETMTQLKEELNLKYDKYFDKADRYKKIMKQLKTQLDAHKKAEADLTEAYKWT